MSRRGVFLASAYSGSEEVFEFCCTPCSKSNRIAEAEKQCLDCREYFCRKCLGFHDTFGATSGHRMLEKDKMRTQLGSSLEEVLPRVRCQVHSGEHLTTYCAEHDTVCCNICIAVDHKSCDRLFYIHKVAQVTMKGNDVSNLERDVKSTLKELKKSRTDFQHHLDTLGSERNTALIQLREFAKGIEKSIKALEKTDSDQIQTLYERKHAGTERVISSFDEMIQGMEETLRQLERSEQKHDVQVFVDLKSGQRRVAEAKQTLRETGTTSKTSVKFVIDPDIEKDLAHLRRLGTVIEEDIGLRENENTEESMDEMKVYKARFLGEFDVYVTGDMSACIITGSCLLPDKTLILADFNNQRLIHMDTSYKATNTCIVEEVPWGVACTGPTEIAVTVTEKRQVQFVSIGTRMALGRSFSTIDSCRGICFSNDELLVACGGEGEGDGPGHVAVFSVSGVLLRKIQTDPSGQRLFIWPTMLAASPDGSRIHVTQDSDVVTVDRSDGFICHSLTKLNGASGVCTITNGHFLVCCQNSHTVLQVDRNGNKVAELLNFGDGVVKPRSVCFESATCRLIVTMYGCKKIKVFDLE